MKARILGAAASALILGSVFTATSAMADFLNQGGEVASLPRGKIPFEDCFALATRTVNGHVTSAEFKTEGGVPRYEFEIVTESGTAWNVDCNAETGFLEHIERHIDPKDPIFVAQAKINQEEAEKRALQMMPGEIDHREWIINEEGHALYVLDVDSDAGGEFKVEVLASTGDIHGFNPEYWEIGEHK